MMTGRHLLYALALVATPVVASAARVPSAVYNGLSYGPSWTHAGPAVRVARPGHYRYSNERSGDQSYGHSNDNSDEQSNGHSNGHSNDNSDEQSNGHSNDHHRLDNDQGGDSNGAGP